MYRVLSGFILSWRHSNVTQTRSNTPSHACLGRSDELENRCNGAQQWRYYDGKRWGTGSTAASWPERWGASSATAA